MFCTGCVVSGGPSQTATWLFGDSGLKNSSRLTMPSTTDTPPSLVVIEFETSLTLLKIPAASSARTVIAPPASTCSPPVAPALSILASAELLSRLLASTALRPMPDVNRIASAMFCTALLTVALIFASFVASTETSPVASTSVSTIRPTRLGSDPQRGRSSCRAASRSRARRTRRADCRK